MTDAPSVHLGLDLGGTNLKWAAVERQAGDVWREMDHGQGPTDAHEDPEAVIARMADVARTALVRWPPIASVGIGVPGLYDPVAGSTRFLVNVPGMWAGRPVAPPIEAALGIPVALINDARPFGLAELRLGAGRGAHSMIGLTLGTGVGGVIAIDGQIHQGHDSTAGEIGHQTIDPDGPAATAAIAAASRHSPGPTGSRPRAARPPSPRPSRRRGPGTSGRSRASPRSAVISASASPTWSSSSRPTAS